MPHTSPTSTLRGAPRAALACAVVLVVLGVAASASAQQRRDFMLDYQPRGTNLLFDYFGSGAQLSIERREPIYGKANDFTFGATTLLAYPGGEVTTRADLRVLFLNLGGTLAYRAVWRNLSFDAGPDTYCVRCDRAARREMDPIFGKTPGTDHWYWAEARASLLAPLNEHLALASLVAVRHEDAEPRAYDWFYASVHDGGLIARWETQLFVKHRDWGGIGPYVQLMSLPRAGEHESQLAWGFNATTRLGLVPRNDLLFLTFLVRPGDSSYGQHAYFAPVRALLIYRMIFAL